MIRVFGYLVWRSAFNRIARQLRRLRSPRYLVALLLGAGYLWIVAFQQRPAPASAQVADSRWFELVGALAVAGAVAWGWVFAVERRVLSFTPAEVTFLFAGPVSRRGLIQFKLLRSQLVILFNALLWTLILSRERFGVSPWLRAVSIWVLLTTLSFHRLGASFVRTSLLEHGRFGVRHRAVSLAVLGGTLLALLWSIADSLPVIAAGWAEGVGSFLVALGEAASRPLPSALLFPFELMVRPLAADTPAQWLFAIGPALLVLLLHYVWVVRSDTAFEEAAAEASLRRTRAAPDGRPDRRAPAKAIHRATPAMIRLAPVGWPGGAILWKNLLAVVRTRRIRNVVMAFVLGSALVAALSFDPDGALAEIAGWFAATWAGLLILIGPQWVRNDLRNDLLKLDLLRSYPLRGTTVVAAEVAASTLVLTIIQLGLLLLAYLAFLGNRSLEPGLAVRSLVGLGAVVFLPGINFMGMLIHNGVAILFPAWVHLGAGRAGGIEALGQNVLMIVVFVAVLGLTLVVPAAIGGATFLLLHSPVGLWGLGPASILALGVLVFEAALAVDWLGGIFERTDPAAAGIAV